MSLRFIVIALALSSCTAPETQNHRTSDVGPDPRTEMGADPSDMSDADGAPDVRDVRDTIDAPDASLPDTGEPARPWRSALYPADWDANRTDPDGRFLPDFSWAGYRNGEQPVVRVSTTFDVLDFGADASGATDSQPAFQAAIDAASLAGGVVTVPEGLFRIDDQLLVTASDVVLRGQGAATSRLWFTRSAQMSSRSHLTFRGSVTVVSERPLDADGAERAHAIDLADTTALTTGDDIIVGWTISPEFVDEHAMTDVWQAFNGTWQPFFLRDVSAVTATGLDVDVPLRYPARVRDGASVRHVTGYLRNVGVENIGVADAVGWEQAWTETQVHVIELNGVADGWISGVESFASPGAPTAGPGSGAHLQNGGIIVRGSKRITVADSRLERAQNRGVGGSGYLFEVRQSSEVLFRDLVARAGRHNFIQNWGFGTTGMVWLRVHSSEGQTFLERDAQFSGVGDSEFHHSLAMANLIDSSTFDDGLSALNRKDQSSGAGHTATQTVFWNTRGTGRIRSYQWGHGYVIGTAPGMSVLTDMPTDDPALRAQLEDVGPWTAAWPADWLEGRGRAQDLEPRSLYEDQRARRLAR